MKICMIAGDNTHYVHSLVQALSNIGLRVELIGSDSNKEFNYSPLVTLINLRGSREPNACLLAKMIRIPRYYLKCFSYMLKSNIKILHIQTFRFDFIEGIILVLLYKILGKKIIYTAHNIQPKGKRDIYNYILFYIIYRCVNHIICHTPKLKKDLVSRYRINNEKVSIVHHGLNYSVPITQISQTETRNRLDIDLQARVLLLFGAIQPYKGYEIALKAFKHLQVSNERIYLLIAGWVPKKGLPYLQMLKEYVEKEGLKSSVRFYVQRIADNEIELFFKAADVLILPYIECDFQSGVLFLAYRFGLPVIASDVGSFSEEIENGIRGYIFLPKSSADLAAKIQQFYQELYLRSDIRQHIQQHVMEKYSWDCISRTTLEVYKRVLQED